MSKQARAIKAQHEADEKATKIINEAVDRVLERPTRGKPLDPALLALAPAIKEGRDNGEAWWKIAHRLGLPGSADMVAKGKAGAGLARKVYATAFGALPPKPPKADAAEKAPRKPRSTRGERNDAVRALRGQRTADRTAKVQRGEAVIDLNMEEDALRDMLKGRMITWVINLNDIDGKGDSFSEDSATVHPRWMRFGEDIAGNRIITFKTLETLKGVKGDGRFQAGATRTVRLASIHTVGS